MKHDAIYGWIVISICLLFPTQTAVAQIQLVSTGAVWKYLDNGSNPDAWRTGDYDDGPWAMGPAPLGYGDGDEATTNSFGSDPNNKFITTYYRHSFIVADASVFTNLSVRLLRDDGGVVYLNGTEIFRSNMPTNEITFTTHAASNVPSGDETTNFYATAVDPGLLINDVNLLAVEIHQVTNTSSDISFDLTLTGNYTPVPPKVTITGPTNDAIVSRGNVTLYANAWDSWGSIARVDFFENDSKLGEAFVAPYKLTWPNIPIGSHTFTAVAVNNSGLSATSAPVAITVLPALIHSGAQWNYLDDGSNQDTAWRDLNFNDSGWSNGVAELGYGDGGEGTIIGGGPGTNGIITTITTYFRHVFEVPDKSGFSNLVLRLLRDDGGIVYLNGTEVFRSNMPQGPASFTNFAASIVNVPQESQFYSTNVPLGLLNVGSNIVAVEIHQGNNTSSDVSFNLELLPNIPPTSPTVSLTGPTNNATFVSPANVTVTAGATDFDGTIAQVTFLIGSNPTGMDATEPYSLSVSNLAAGNYQLRAVTTDDSGRMATSAPVAITVLSPPFMHSLIATGAVWKYLDDGINQGTNWAWPTFDDGGWSDGWAKFGAVDPHVTPIHTGSSNVTSYFRHQFAVANATAYTNLAFRVLRDDGAIVYLNGNELFRMNMPTGTVNYMTPPLSAVGGSDEVTYFPTNISAALVEGTNILAVELHQQSGGSGDAGFDLGLLGVAPFDSLFSLSIQRSNLNVIVEWTANGVVLEEASTPTGSWSPVMPAPSSPYAVAPNGAARFYRLRRPQ